MSYGHREPSLNRSESDLLILNVNAERVAVSSIGWLDLCHVPSSCLSSAAEMSYLRFHKRILPQLFVGKMLVREHGYEIEGFRPYIQDVMRDTGRDPRHIL